MFVQYSRARKGTKEGWVKGLAMKKGRPLYRRPEMLEADAKCPIMIVEGEKCANAAAEAFPDYVVTTWAGGTNAWDRTDWQSLAKRNVLLIADADEPGRKAMNKIAKHLSGLGCAVRMYLPKDDDKSDIADWLETEGAEAVLTRIETGAVKWGPSGNAPTSATDASETTIGSEWASSLVERAKDDPGAPFEVAMLRRLVALKCARPDEWERLRVALKGYGVRVSELDKAIDRPTDGRERDLQGQPIEWQAPEPWPEPVDGVALLDEVATIVRQYVQMPEPAADAVALWIVHTWLHDRLEISTFLNVTSATKRCGKSLLMEVLGTLVFRPLPVSGRITPAALFRIIERDEPTLLLDEADTYFREDPELRGICNGSQRRDSAYVVRCVGDDHEPRNFKTWSAKAISGIGSLHDTVRDRSLVIRLDRRPPNLGDLPRWRERNRQNIEDIQKKLARLISDNADFILARRNAVSYPPCLHDRARDAWEALFAIADCAGGEWAAEGGRAWRAAEVISADTEDETGQREMLLADIHKVFREAGYPKFLLTGFILEKLKAMEDRPWPEYRRGNPLTPQGLASLLKPFDIAPGTIRADGIATAGGTAKGYKRNTFVQVWKNYSIHDTPFPSVTPSQPLPGNEFDASTSVTISNPVTDRNS